MIEVFLKGRDDSYYASGYYDEISKKLVVKKGAHVKTSIDQFKGSNSIAKNRAGKLHNGILIEDCAFNSASTAANFITGRSTNGLIAWKDKNGTSLKKILNT